MQQTAEMTAAIQETLNDVADALRPGSNDLTRRQQRQDLRKWLSPPDPSINHNIARTAHYESTAAWFFEGSVFNEWKSAPSLLWMHGKRTLFLYSTTPYLMVPDFVAGSGKSVLWLVVSQLSLPIWTKIIEQLLNSRTCHGPS
jgi:hypothetical protein